MNSQRLSWIAARSLPVASVVILGGTEAASAQVPRPVRNACQRAHRRGRMLSHCCRRSGFAARRTDVLAFVQLSDSRRGRGGQGTARNRRRIIRQGLALHHRRRGLAPAKRRAYCRAWSVPDRRRQAIYGALYGSSLHSGNARSHPSTFGTRGLVSGLRSPMLGDADGHHGCARRRGRCRAGRSANGPIECRWGDAPIHTACSSRWFPTVDHDGTRLAAEGLMPEIERCRTM